MVVQKRAEMIASLLHKIRRENISDSNLCTVWIEETKKRSTFSAIASVEESLLHPYSKPTTRQQKIN